MPFSFCLPCLPAIGTPGCRPVALDSTFILKAWLKNHCHPMTPKSIFNLSLIVNSQTWSGDVPIEETLLELLRNRLRLTGTKRSCESEVCGTCTVLVEGRPVSSCNFLAFEAHQKSVLTIEGVADD